MISNLAKRFNVVSELSDNTLGIVIPIVATTHGAKVIEKHFIIDRSIGGPDTSFSMDDFFFSNGKGGS